MPFANISTFLFPSAVAGAMLLFASWAGAQPGFRGGPRELVKTYDKDGDGFLNLAERQLARGNRRNANAKPPEGKKVTPADVKQYSDEPLYDPKVLRTLFLEFEDPDWENELADFYNTDVEVPARLTVDGKTYRDVGIHYRGQTSYRVTGVGVKASLSLSIDFRNKEQRLLGYRSLNLMNSNADPTYMRIALYHEIARHYIAAPKVNWVRVVINGEPWGIYVNSQQFNGDFTKDFFNTAEGARWKVPGSPGASGGGLGYWSDNPADYQRFYEIKTKDDPKSWAALVNLCKVLNTTAPEKLEQALAPVLDVDAALRFLALDKALINNDGYWTRGSDYALFQHPDGRFYAIPQDANESLRELESMGRFGGDGGWGVQLDPFAGSQDASKALLARLLAVPALRTRYLGFLREIAEKSMDWSKLAPKVAEHQALIAADVEADLHKLDSFANFQAAVATDSNSGGGFAGRPSFSLKTFFEQRRAYLLGYPGIT